MNTKPNILGIIPARMGSSRFPGKPMARIAPQPLPDDTPPMPYVDLVSRLRQLAMSAHEAFYLDRWDEVETTARALQQSARFLTKALSVRNGIEP